MHLLNKSRIFKGITVLFLSLLITSSETALGYTFPTVKGPSCNLSGGIIVDLGSQVMYAAKGNHHKTNVSGFNVPAGKYNITIQTWDNHSGHGGQNQKKEVVHINLMNAAGTLIVEGMKSQDLPENKDIQNTTHSNINLTSAITSIFAKHAYYDQTGGEPESIAPVCIQFKEIDTPVVNPTNPTASCSVSDSTIEEGDSVTFTGNATGGNSPYTYKWTGDATSNSKSFSKTFNSEGKYYVTLEVTDENGRKDTDTCPVIVVSEEDEDEDDDDLEVECRISDSRIDAGDRVTIEARVRGGNSPYEIKWSGDDRDIDDFDDEDDKQTVRIEDEGRYELKVTVEDDDGNKDSDTCTIRVDDDNNVSTTIDGELAGISSVYLNQVPYTGPEDVLKIFGFISLLLVWSSVIAFYFLKDKNRKVISNKIESFKAANKARLGIN